MLKGTCIRCEGKQNYMSRKTRTLSIGKLKSVEVSTIVCVECGYVEDYVLDAADRDALAGKWAKVLRHHNDP